MQNGYGRRDINVPPFAAYLTVLIFRYVTHDYTRPEY